VVSHIQTIYIPWKSETIKRMVHRNCWVQITAHIVVFRKNPLIHAQLGPTILSYTIYSINIWFSVRKKNTQFCETLLWYTDHPCYAYIYLVHVYGFQKNEWIYTMYKHVSYVCFSIVFFWCFVSNKQQNYREAHTIKNINQRKLKKSSEIPQTTCLLGELGDVCRAWSFLAVLYVGVRPNLHSTHLAAPKIRSWVT